MRKQEYLNLKKEAEKRYRKTIQLASTRYTDDLHSIEKVWALSQGLDFEKHQIIASKPNTPTTLIGLIRAVVQDLVGEFEVNEVAAILEASGIAKGKTIRKSSISSALGRMVDQEEVVVVKRGSGARPQVYRRSKVTKKSKE